MFRRFFLGILYTLYFLVIPVALLLWIATSTILNRDFYTSTLVDRVYSPVISSVSEEIFVQNDILSKQFSVQQLEGILEKSFPREKVQSLIDTILDDMGESLEEEGSTPETIPLELKEFKEKLSFNISQFLISYIKSLPPCEGKVNGEDEIRCNDQLDTSSEAIQTFIDSRFAPDQLVAGIPDRYEVEVPKLSIPQQTQDFWQYRNWIIWGIPGILLLLILLLSLKEIPKFFRGQMSVLIGMAVIFIFISVGISYGRYELEQSFPYAQLDYSKPIFDAVLSIIQQSIMNAIIVFAGLAALCAVLFFIFPKSQKKS